MFASPRGPHTRMPSCGRPGDPQTDLDHPHTVHPTRHVHTFLSEAEVSYAAPELRAAISNTICARRHVTTDPDECRTIRNSRFRSSFEISRTRKHSLDTTTS